jgi:hypothetical protein
VAHWERVLHSRVRWVLRSVFLLLTLADPTSCFLFP